MLQADPAQQARGVALRVHEVWRVFPGGVAALERLSLDVAPGEFVAILGPSGCGKSTLLRLIAGLDRPTAGAVALEHPAGAASGDRREIAYVFQDAHLLPWRNVLRNVQLPLELMGVNPVERDRAARGAVEQVGLADALRRYPAQLSGGMRMRASLARALVTEPKLLLLDEPFAALDEITRHRLDEQLRRLWADSGITVIFVTHSITEAAFLADRAVVMSRRPGRILLNQKLDLPAERTGALRTEVRFERAVKTLYDALVRAEAGER